MANTVSLCLICKNEKSNIGFLMDDVCPVLEEVHITDTGSTDGTLEILAEKQKKYPNLHIHHFTWVDHFSEARNFSFSKAGNVDWIFWVDSDDRVNSNDLKYFKDNLLDSDPAVDTWLLPYVYSKYPDGSPQTLLTRERFIRKRVNPSWIGAIHETIAIAHLRQRNYENLKIEHNRDGKFIEPKRNLRILEKEFEKNPRDPRTAYYFAKELFDHIDPKAKEKLLHYLTLDGKYWDDEIGARFRLAKIYLSENNFREAIQVVDFVYHLDGTRKRSEYYFIYGEVEYRLCNFEIAADWYKRCLYDPPGPPRVLALEYWTWHPLRKLADCCVQLGKWDEVFECTQKIQAILTNDENTKAWIAGLQTYKLHPKDNSSLAILEFGTELRQDSYKVNKESFKVSLGTSNPMYVNWKLNRYFPFLTGSLDGIVLDKSFNFYVSELARMVKAGGFVWSTEPLLYTTGYQTDHFNNLGKVKYNNQDLWHYIRIDESKPSIGYRADDNCMNYAGFRHRIFNLVMSAKKQGYPVYNLVEEMRDVDIHIDMEMPKRFGKINILEFCEKIDKYYCNVENADILDACSPLLAEHLKEKYPNKIVINVDDHFEMPLEGWL